MEIDNKATYSEIFKLQQDFPDSYKKGQEFGKIGNALWTPNDSPNTSGKIIPYIKEVIDFMIENEVMEKIK